MRYEGFTTLMARLDAEPYAGPMTVSEDARTGTRITRYNEFCGRDYNGQLLLFWDRLVTRQGYALRSDVVAVQRRWNQPR